MTNTNYSTHILGPQSNFVKMVLLNVASSLLGPQGQTWSMHDDGRRDISFRVSNPDDLAHLAERLDGLALIEPCASEATR